MRTLIFILLVLPTYNLFGQANWSFEKKIDFDRYSSYKGTINEKYPITMYLEESYESCNKNSSRWTPRKVYGWYMYDKVGKKIPLIGHVCYADACETYLKLFVPEDPIDYSFDESCNLLGAKEIFTQDIGSNTLEWQIKDEPKYPVQLNPAHEFSWSTKANLVLNINNLEIETFNLNELAENNYIETIEFLTYKRVGDKFHLIFKYSHQSNPGSYGFGMCGAGIEEFLGHLIVDNKFKVESFKQIQINSCINSFDNVEVTYDLNYPEMGIKRKN